MSETTRRLAFPAPTDARRFGTGVLAVATIAGLWQLWAHQSDGRIPTISEVIAHGANLVATGELPHALVVSIGRVLAGFAIASAVGIPVGLAMGYLRPLGRFVDPLLQAFRSIAPIAVLPLFLLWFGQGNAAAALVVAYAAVFPIIVNTIEGVARADAKLVAAAKTLGLPPMQILLHVLVPGAVPNIITGARIGMGIAWGAIIAAELAVGSESGASGGIGQLMFASYAYQLDVGNLVVYMISVGVVGYLIDRGFRAVIRHVSPAHRGV